MSLINSSNIILNSGEKLGWKENSWNLFLRNMVTVGTIRLCSVETGVILPPKQTRSQEAGVRIQLMRKFVNAHTEPV